jgi:hypothetical protein
MVLALVDRNCLMGWVQHFGKSKGCSKSGEPTAVPGTCLINGGIFIFFFIIIIVVF